MKYVLFFVFILMSMGGCNLTKPSTQSQPPSLNIDKPKYEAGEEADLASLSDDSNTEETEVSTRGIKKKKSCLSTTCSSFATSTKRPKKPTVSQVPTSQIPPSVRNQLAAIVNRPTNGTPVSQPSYPIPSPPPQTSQTPTTQIYPPISSPTTNVKKEDCHRQRILTATSCIGDDIDTEERKLYQLVNEYRAQNGLPNIPLSSSLNLVANRHVRDLQENIRTLTHGWSNCSYNDNDKNSHPCMWEAPQRLKTSYRGNGYENAHGGGNGYKASAMSSLNGWKKSKFHNEVILNQGIWKNRTWRALGIGIYEGYAVLWFGDELDN